MSESIWGVAVTPTLCEACDAHYLLPADMVAALPQCPSCMAQPLALYEPSSQSYSPPAPELVVSFTVDRDTLAEQLTEFAQGIWFAPSDLKPETLQQRLQPVFLPMWLVDSPVQANWQAEVGFDYEVVSYHDSYRQGQGGWQSQQITETRIRWEPRAGHLRRTYHNMPAPALEEHATIIARLGDFGLNSTAPYRPEAITHALVRLPNRPPEDAWPDTAPAFQAAAAEECRRAGQVAHIREFRWTPSFGQPHWTLLLLPIYTAFYHDDDGQPQKIVVHGQTGRLHGQRRASMKRARRAALIIAGIAVVIFTVSLLVGLASIALPPLLLLAILGAVLAVIAGGAAIVPLVIVWQFNKNRGT